MSTPIPWGKAPMLVISAILCINAPLAAKARPVSYSGGWMFMTGNDMSTNGASLVYSPTATTGIGPFFDHYRDTDGELAGISLNWLARRWNNRDSQGNFYLLSGFGVASGTGRQRAGGYAGMEADWEDRRYYISYENRYTAAGEDVRQEFQQKGRLGIAPYVAEAGGVHTWLMLQADHTPEDQDNWTVTPLVRVFKGDYLAEAGVSNRGTFLFNLMITY